MQHLFIAFPLSLFALGLAVGLMSGFFGVGGGSLLIPLLHLVLHVPFDRAVGTGVAAIVVGATSGAVNHWRRGNVCWPIATTIAIAGVFTVTPGVATLEYLKGISADTHGVTAVDFWLSLAYTGLLGVIGLIVFREASRALTRPPRGGRVETSLTRLVGRVNWRPRCSVRGLEHRPLSLWPVAVLGMIAGFLSGLMGIGGGPFMVSALIYAIGVPTSQAVGSTLCALLWVATSSAVQHFTKHNVSLPSAAVLALAAALGATAGAYIHSRLRPARVRLYFAVVLFLIAASLALKLCLRLAAG